MIITIWMGGGIIITYVTLNVHMITGSTIGMMSIIIMYVTLNVCRITGEGRRYCHNVSDFKCILVCTISTIGMI